MSNPAFSFAARPALAAAELQNGNRYARSMARNGRNAMAWLNTIDDVGPTVRQAARTTPKPPPRRVNPVITAPRVTSQMPSKALRARSTGAETAGVRNRVLRAYSRPLEPGGLVVKQDATQAAYASRQQLVDASYGNVVGPSLPYARQGDDTNAIIRAANAVVLASHTNDPSRLAAALNVLADTVRTAALTLSTTASLLYQIQSTITNQARLPAGALNFVNNLLTACIDYLNGPTPSRAQIVQSAAATQLIVPNVASAGPAPPFGGPQGPAAPPPTQPPPPPPQGPPPAPPPAAAATIGISPPPPPIIPPTGMGPQAFNSSQQMTGNGTQPAAPPQVQAQINPNPPDAENDPLPLTGFWGNDDDDDTHMGNDADAGEPLAGYAELIAEARARRGNIEAENRLRETEDARRAAEAIAQRAVDEGRPHAAAEEQENVAQARADERQSEEAAQNAVREHEEAPAARARQEREQLMEQDAAISEQNHQDALVSEAAAERAQREREARDAAEAAARAHAAADQHEEEERAAMQEGNEAAAEQARQAREAAEAEAREEEARREEAERSAVDAGQRVDGRPKNDRDARAERRNQKRAEDDILDQAMRPAAVMETAADNDATNGELRADGAFTQPQRRFVQAFFNRYGRDATMRQARRAATTIGGFDSSDFISSPEFEQMRPATRAVDAPPPQEETRGEAEALVRRLRSVYQPPEEKRNEAAAPSTKKPRLKRRGGQLHGGAEDEDDEDDPEFFYYFLDGEPVTHLETIDDVRAFKQHLHKHNMLDGFISVRKTDVRPAIASTCEGCRAAHAGRPLANLLAHCGPGGCEKDPLDFYDDDEEETHAAAAAPAAAAPAAAAAAPAAAAPAAVDPMTATIAAIGHLPQNRQEMFRFLDEYAARVGPSYYDGAERGKKRRTTRKAAENVKRGPAAVYHPSSDDDEATVIDDGGGLKRKKKQPQRRTSACDICGATRHKLGHPHGAVK